MILKNLNISKAWTLFLDRDGVINRRLVDDYVKSWDEFEFLEGVPEALRIFSEIFGKIIVVTNQRGIGRGLMTKETLMGIHQRMVQEIAHAGGRIDSVYFCPDLKDSGSFCRKPQVGMGLRAKKDFPDIRFKKSLMAGDSVSDLEFGKRLGMKTVLIDKSLLIARRHPLLTDYRFDSLITFAHVLKKEFL